MTVRKLPFIISSLLCLSLTPLVGAHASSTSHALTALAPAAKTPFSSLASSQNADSTSTLLATSAILMNNNDVVEPNLSAFMKLQQAEHDVNTLHTQDNPELMQPHAMMHQTAQHAAPKPKATSKPKSKPHMPQPLSSRGGSSPLEAASSIGSAVAVYSERFLGVPYRWGGSSPSGFDCSGFVAYSYSHFGVHLSHSSYAQFGVGTAVSRSNLQAGDLVFFDAYGSGASHVGIYLGGGQFINAAGSSVRIDSLGESYWASHYLGARRIH